MSYSTADVVLTCRAEPARSGPSSMLPEPRRDADVDTTAARASAHRHRGSCTVGWDAVGRDGKREGATAIPLVERVTQRRLLEMSPATEGSERPLLLLSSPPEVCTNTPRASLFHRKNKCHLYQMAMDFQHKQYFCDTRVIVIIYVQQERLL